MPNIRKKKKWKSITLIIVCNTDVVAVKVDDLLQFTVMGGVGVDEPFWKEN